MLANKELDSLNVNLDDCMTIKMPSAEAVEQALQLYDSISNLGFFVPIIKVLAAKSPEEHYIVLQKQKCTLSELIRNPDFSPTQKYIILHKVGFMLIMLRNASFSYFSLDSDHIFIDSNNEPLLMISAVPEKEISALYGILIHDVIMGTVTKLSSKVTIDLSFSKADFESPDVQYNYSDLQKITQSCFERSTGYMASFIALENILLFKGLNTRRIYIYFKHLTDCFVDIALEISLNLYYSMKMIIAGRSKHDGDMMVEGIPNIIKKSPLGGDLVFGKELIEEAIRYGSKKALHLKGELCSLGVGYPKSIETAIEIFNENAKSGYAIDCRTLGHLYFLGEMVPKDEAMAYKYYKMGVELNDSQCMNQLGNFYWEGRGGCPVDYEESVKLYSRAAEQGDVMAIRNLAHRYYNGIYLEKDVDKAMELYVVSADGGCSDAQLDLGNIYMEKEDFDRAEKYYRMAAKAGNAKAISNLGVLESKRKDNNAKNDALRHFVEAAELGNDVAMSLAAQELFQMKRFEEAFKYAERAASMGNENAMFLLGQLLIEGVGCEKDPERGKLLLKELYDKGHTKVWTMLCRACEITGDKDMMVAVLQEVAHSDNDDGMAAYILGQIMMKDDETKRDAFELFKLSAAKRYPDGIAMMGVCLDQGIGVERNQIVAIQLIMTAKGMGSKRAEACFRPIREDQLEELFTTGKVERDNIGERKEDNDENENNNNN